CPQLWGSGSGVGMHGAPPVARPGRPFLIIATAQGAQPVATSRPSGGPAASIGAVFFFHRVWMMRLTEPGGLNVVLAPYGVEPESWMSVLAYDSLSYRRMSELYSRWVRVAEMAPSPMSAPPPSPQNAVQLMG